MKLIPLLDGDDLSALQLGVIVENWHSRSGSRRNREAFAAAFTLEEAARLNKMYPTLYRWSLVTGYPASVPMPLATLRLLKKAANYFGTM